MRPRRFTFRTKFILLVLGSCLLPTLLLGQLAYLALRQEVHDSTSTLLEAVAQSSAHQVSLWLEEQRSTTFAVARSNDLLQSWRERDRHDKESDDYFVALFRMYQVLSVCDQSSRWFTEVRLGELDGTVFLSDNSQSFQGKIVPPEAEVDLKKVFTDGTAVYSNVYVENSPIPAHISSDDFSTGIPTMILVAPVRGEGEATGLLACRLGIADLGTVFPTEASNVVLDIFLLRNDGLLVSSNRGITKEEFRHQRIPLPDRGGAFPRPGHSLRGYKDYAGATVVGAWEPVLGTDMGILVQVHRDQLTATLRSAVQLMLSLSLGLSVFCSVIAFMAADRLLKPLRQLTLAARLLGEGQRTIRVALRRKDEIGDLGDTFDRMAATLEMTVEALETARDQALAAYQAKSRFLANMTHELRTPLNAVIGYSEMLIGEVSDAGNEQWVEDLGVIRRSGKDLLQLINGILDLSKMEAGKMLVDAEDFSLAELLREVSLVMVPLVKDKGNQLVNVYEEQDVLFQDRLKMKQILLNLLSNAVKFTQKGEVRLGAIRLGDKVRVFVKDQGIGMSEEQVARVFDEFAQADESTTRKYGGTGLGLTLVRRFAELLGGKVEVQSVLGQGATFTVEIPLNYEPPDSD